MATPAVGASVIGLMGLDVCMATYREKTSYRIQHVEKVFEAFMSPGLVTEELYFFISDNDDSLKAGKGDGIEDEGEGIEVLELPLSEGLEMICTGEIVDSKTIMLLQHVALSVAMVSAA
ncbi:hypothetical protein [Kushneria marisflavi]|uniref:Nudix hydrolase domain-containing protein n=1 Tax=Kushneria marisflavi TaxID=157779 RepID=A0A240ULA7_9GAMM|nr:hypothetical protein [Kushneria marisflavi]ART62281.1 hypothetical protein B9H00_03665 [Kushneria marisflavi]